MSGMRTSLSLTLVSGAPVVKPLYAFQYVGPLRIAGEVTMVPVGSFQAGH
jgi:hypothetical protein